MQTNKVLLKCHTLPVIATLLAFNAASAADNLAPSGFVSLFNGKDFTGWTVPAGDNGHWKIVDGVIDYDARSEAKGDKTLWSGKEFGDFVLHVDWRIKETPYVNPNVPYILPDGTHAHSYLSHACSSTSAAVPAPTPLAASSSRPRLASA